MAMASELRRGLKHFIPASSQGSDTCQQKPSRTRKQTQLGRLSGDQAKRFYEELTFEASCKSRVNSTKTQKEPEKYEEDFVDDSEERKNFETPIPNNRRHFKTRKPSTPSNAVSAYEKRHRSESISFLTKAERSQTDDALPQDKVSTKSVNKKASSCSIVNRFLKSAQEGELQKMKEFLSKHIIDINSRDYYGWTALMCASHNGHSEVVSYLLHQNAVWKDVCDIKGHSALDLARISGHNKVVNILENFNVYNKKKRRRKQMDESSSKETVVKVWCKICEQEYDGDERRHISSTIHLFKCQKESKTIYHIPENNIGYQLLLKKGWDEEKGLGKEGSGCKFPVKTILKRDREGFGAESEKKPRITHFSSYDLSAIQRKNVASPSQRIPKKMTKLERKKKDKKEKAWEQEFRMSFLTD